MSNEITCLIADDHEVVRGLRLSSPARRRSVVGEARRRRAVAVAERRAERGDHGRMPGMDGLEATKILAERLPPRRPCSSSRYGERSLLAAVSRRAPRATS